MSSTTMGDDEPVPPTGPVGEPPATHANGNGRTQSGSWSPFPFEDLTNRPWREEALTREAELRTLLERFRGNHHGSDDSSHSLVDGAIANHLEEAAKVAKGLSKMRPVHNVTTMDRVTSNLDAAEVGLLG